MKQKHLFQANLRFTKPHNTSLHMIFGENKNNARDLHNTFKLKNSMSTKTYTFCSKNIYNIYGNYLYIKKYLTITTLVQL